MNSLDIVNSILANSGYSERIPEATRTNIATVGNTILSYEPTANAFFTQLVNRIGKVIIDRMDGMEDIYAVFKDGKLELGDTIQKIFIDIPSAQAFDGTATTSMLSQNKGTIHVEYTKVDRKLFYKTTWSVAQLKEAFTSVERLDAFITALIEAMSTALSMDKYIMLTQALYEHCIYVYQVKDVNLANYNHVGVMNVPESVAKYNKTTGEIEWDTVGAKVFLKLLRVASRSLQFYHKLSYGSIADSSLASDKGTIKAVRTPLAKQVLALEVSTLANIDVDALATLFNLEPAKLQTSVIELEDGALGYAKSKAGVTVDYYIGGFICNKDAVERGTSFEDTDSFKNPESQAVNFWQHYWGYMAVSKFKDFVPIVFKAYTPQA